jgi:glycosyltransferase involved in cell wall biosynthesis
MRELATELSLRNWQVDVITTCARSNYTWQNDYPSGLTHVQDRMTVRRFPIVLPPSWDSRIKYEGRIWRGDNVTFDEQLEWLNGLFTVPELFQYLVERESQYDALIFSPYLFWTTAMGATVAPERTVVIPCLHDEPYARLEVLQAALRGPSTVWFLSEPERDLADRLCGLSKHHSVVGAGIKVPTSYDPEDFRVRHGIPGPFLLYVGRREKGKGWGWLRDAYRFAQSHLDAPISLVTVGGGIDNDQREPRNPGIDLGHIGDQEVANACSAALALAQPSPNESFSRVMMEAWLAGTPVIATDQSDVVKWHSARSGGALLVADEIEFAYALDFLLSNPDTARDIGARGREYVLGHYQMQDVVDRIEQELLDLV